ncbi:ketoacyl-synt-domain-containing protein [Xylaria sp. FL0933]|nr:ketoacyl-synt-domain-containing protein [Xylaria sp. FL0933]
MASKDVLLFAGQGSNSYMSDSESIHELEALLAMEPTAWQVISTGCLEALHVEYGSMGPEDRLRLGLEVPDVFNTVAEYLIYRPRDSWQQPIPTAIGVCTGMLPAVISVAASSQSREGFVKTIIEGFRLAFWIGARSSLWCRKASDTAWRETSCVLSVFGFPVAQAGGLLTPSKSRDSPLSIPTTRVSSIFGDDAFSISGLGPELNRIEASLASQSIRFRRAQVHGLYHGGEDMRELVHHVLSDVRSRNIEFPVWDSLLAPVRSTTSGLLMKQTPDSGTLLEATLCHIFIDMVDWRATARSVASEAVIEQHVPNMRIVCIGPGAESLARHGSNLWASAGVSVVGNLLRSLSSPSPDDIAIVGLSSNLPCGRGVEQLWEALENGRSTATEIPSSRFELKGFAPHGNFLWDIFDFDPAFFNISPREAKSIDPQQRLLLRAALEALDDAGYSPDATPTFQRDTFGVYIGVATGDYVDNLRNDIDVYYSPGTLRAFLSGRISYVFGFQGPSVVVDTACSSSTVALHQACRAIQAGDCTAALAGGVNSISSPYMYAGLSRGHFLSPTGQCKPFDAGADGYCRSEGCGLVVLKKLSHALAENDEIYGVIRGIGINQSGTAISITHPDQEIQASLFRRTLNVAKISPESINLIEAHGTGTQAGDAAEISSIASTFGVRPPNNPLYINSIKGNIGHPEAASGVAGLIKILASIQKRQIPLQASHSRLNPRLEQVESHNFIIPKLTESWNVVSSRIPRRAMLNNFGAAGSNAAVIVEEYVPRSHQRHTPSRGTIAPHYSQHILNISAKSQKALETLRNSYLEYITSTPGLRIEDVCYTANARRMHHPQYRLSVVGRDLDQLSSRMKEAKAKSRPPAGNMSTPIFVFSGQGGTHPGMGSELYQTAPVFRDAVLRCDDILSGHGFPTVLEYISQKSQPPRNDEELCIVMQCATFVLEYALSQLWVAWGVQPQIVLGHSIGEYAAMVTAQMLSLQDAILFVAKRAVLMTSKCQANATGMLVCRFPTESARTELEVVIRQHANADIACHNGPGDFVVAGPLAALDEIAKSFKSRGHKSKLLQVPYGFHSAAMDPILDDLKEFASTIHLGPPSQIKYGSALYGRCLSADESLNPNYLVRHTRDPVNFAGLMTHLKESCGQPLIIEIGPSGSTRGMFSSAIANAIFLTSISPLETAWTSMAAALQTLFLEGHDANWRSIYHKLAVCFLRSLPGYPLSMSQYLVPFGNDAVRATEDGAMTEEPKYDFVVPQPLASGDSSTRRLYTTLVARVSPFIKAHIVGGVPLCPASVYMEIVLQGLALSSQIESTKQVSVLGNITFDHPFVFSDADKNVVSSLTTTMDFNASGNVSFSCSSQSARSHCTGILTRQTKRENDAFFARKGSYIKRQLQSFLLDPRGSTDTFSTRTIYQQIFTRVVQYGEPFQTIKSLTIRSGGLEGYGTFQLPTSTATAKYACHPAFMDTLLHTSGFMANAYVDLDTVCICAKVERATIPSLGLEDMTGEMSVYSSLVDVGHSIIADAYALDSAGSVLVSIEGMHFRKVSLVSFSAQLSRLAQGVAHVTPTRREIWGPSAGPPRNKPLVKISTNQPAPLVSNVEAVLRTIISKTCGVELDGSDDHSLAELGLDSLLQIELVDEICQRFSSAAIGKSDLEKCDTLAELMTVITGAMEQRSQTHSELLPPNLINDSERSTYTTQPPTPRDEDPNRQTLALQTGLESLLSDLCGLCLTDDEKSISLGLLGVDSLLSIELVQEIQVRFAISLDEASLSLSDLSYVGLEELLTEKTMESITQGSSDLSDSREEEDVRDEVEEASTDSSTSESSINILQRQQSGKRKSDLYLLHDGSGLVSMYSRISPVNRNIYATSSPEFWSRGARPKGSAQTRTLEELAALYIQTIDPTVRSDVILGGK